MDDLFGGKSAKEYIEEKSKQFEREYESLQSKVSGKAVESEEESNESAETEESVVVEEL